MKKNQLTAHNELMGGNEILVSSHSDLNKRKSELVQQNAPNLDEDRTLFQKREIVTENVYLLISIFYSMNKRESAIESQDASTRDDSVSYI